MTSNQHQHEPAQPSGPAPTAPATPQRSPNFGKLLGAALLVAGFGLGLGVGNLVHAGPFGGADSEDLAAAHVDYACDILLRVEETHSDPDAFEDGLNDPVLWETPAAGMLLSAAVRLDPQYEHLQEEATAVVAQSQRVDTEEWAVGAAQACRDL